MRSLATRSHLIQSVLIGIAALGGCLANPAAAVAATEITSCPFVIDQAGEYALAQDLTCSGDGIVITASNVHLSLAGHKLTGPDNGQGVGIKIQGTGA